MRASFLLLGFLIIQIIGANCPSGYSPSTNGDKCYKVYETPASYFAAEHQCSLDGAHLTSIHNGFENTFVCNLVPDNFGFDHWIGLSTLIYGWEWSWLDETAVQYSNWVGGQPNISNKCTLISSTTFRWMTQDCETKLPFICDQPPISANNSC